MGAIVVDDLLLESSQTLLDQTQGQAYLRYPQAELLKYFNAAVSTICGFKLDEYVVTGNISLVSGAKQSLPAGAVAPREFRRNMGASGATPGKAITRVERDDMDYCRPSWMATSGSEIKHVVLDPNDPLTFYVYPQVSPWYIEAAYSSIPAQVALGGTNPLSDKWHGPYIDYIVGRALQKSSLSGDITKADWHARRFAEAVGLTYQGQFRFTALHPQQEQAKQKA